MLLIYDESLGWLRQLVLPLNQIRKHDPDLARQLRRSSCAVVLNLGEGMHAQGGSKRNCYAIALREARESLAALEIGQCLGYVAPAEALLDLNRKIVATCYRLANPRRT